MSVPDINTTIDTLVGEWGGPEFPFQRSFLLFHFCTWIYFPNSPEMRRSANILLAARLLEELGKKHFKLKGPSQYSTPRLEKCLADERYRSLYNNYLSNYGGWTSLLRTPSLADYNRTLQKRFAQCITVYESMDYRFRYLDHGGRNRRDGNISHGQYYHWKARTNKKGNPSPSGKTIRTRWSKNKASAVFLYVSEKLGGSFRPADIRQSDFLERIQEQADDLTKIKTFFGNCAYVAKVLRGSDPTDEPIQIPDSVDIVRLDTEPLSEAERDRMASYGAEYEKMRAS